MNLSLRTWITFIVLTLVMAVNNIYSTLLTGWGDGGSIVSVILCLIFLSRRQGTLANYNLGQTMASGGGAVGFTTAILASVYIVSPTWSPSLPKLSLLIMAISLLGVILAIPLRKTIVRWFFPGAVACGTVLTAVTSDDQSQRTRAKIIMGGFGALSALFTFPTKVAFTKGATALWHHMALPKGFALSFDPLMYGIGMVVGPKIGISMLISSAFMVFFFIPHLTANQFPLGDCVRWTAVGLMTIPAFTSMALALKYKSAQKLPDIFHPRPDSREDRYTKTQGGLIGLLTAVCLAIVVFLMNDQFGVHWGYVIGGLALGMPLCVVLGKVASETDINPVRLVAVILLSVFSLFGTHSPVTLLMMGVCGAALASIVVDLFYDLRTGYLVAANPKHQVGLQLLGVAVASLVTAGFLHILATRFGFGEGKYFPAPGAVVWATMAKGFAAGKGSIPPAAWDLALMATSVGVVLSFLENWPKTRRFMPSTFALGIALLLHLADPGMAPAIFIGGLLRFAAVKIAKRKGEAAEQQMVDDAFQAGSAVFAAAALTGIVAVILITLGIVHLPAE